MGLCLCPIELFRKGLTCLKRMSFNVHSRGINLTDVLMNLFQRIDKGVSSCRRVLADVLFKSSFHNDVPVFPLGNWSFPTRQLEFPNGKTGVTMWCAMNSSSVWLKCILVTYTYCCRTSICYMPLDDEARL